MFTDDKVTVRKSKEQLKKVVQQFAKSAEKMKLQFKKAKTFQVLLLLHRFNIQIK